MKIEEGKYYKAKCGEVFGPIEARSFSAYSRCARSLKDGCFRSWTEKGVECLGEESDFDLIAEVGASPSSPVRTVTRKEIVPGAYGPDARLSVETGTDDASVFIELDDDWYKAAEIREFARLLNEIADAMEEQP